MAEPTVGKLAVLDRAATGLLAIACGDPWRVPARLRLHCLWAVEQLSGVGAHPTRDLKPNASLQVTPTLEAALEALGELSAPDAAGGVLANVITVVREGMSGGD